MLNVPNARVAGARVHIATAPTVDVTIQPSYKSGPNFHCFTRAGHGHCGHWIRSTHHALALAVVVPTITPMQCSGSSARVQFDSDCLWDEPWFYAHSRPIRYFSQKSVVHWAVRLEYTSPLGARWQGPCSYHQGASYPHEAPHSVYIHLPTHINHLKINPK